MSQTKFIIIAVTLVLVWGSAFTMTDVAVRSLAPVWIVAGRMSLAALLITAYVHAKGRRLPPLNDKRWRWYGFIGTFGTALPFFLITWGQETIESGLAAILIGAMPLMTIILAHFFTQERMSWIKLIGFSIGFCGLIILFFPEDFSFTLVSDWKAQALILAAAFCYAAATIAAKLAPETDSTVGASMMLLCGAFFAIICAFAGGIPAAPPEPIAYLMVLGLALGSTSLATILYLYVVDVKGPTIMASINYFIPVTSVIFGIILLGESLSPQIVIAFITIIAGVMISRIKTRPNL